MLRTLVEHDGSLSREMLFWHCGAHRSGYRTLGKLIDLALVVTSVSGTYMTGSDPVTRVRLTTEGRDTIKS